MTLGTKMVVVMMVLLVVVTTLTTYLLVKESNKNVSRAHNELKLANQNQLQLIRGLLTERTVVWVESFAQQALSDESTVAHLKSRVDTHREMLRIQWQAENIWVLDSPMSSISDKANTSEKAINLVFKHTKEQLRPVEHTLCQDICVNMVGVPILVKGNTVAVIIVSTSMQEFIAMLSESFGAKTTIVGFDPSSNRALADELKIMAPLNHQLSAFMQSMLTVIQRQNVSDLVLEGIQLEHQATPYSIFLLPFEQSNKQSFYVLSVHDQSALTNQVAVYQRSVFIAAIILFSTFSVLSYFLFSRFRARLMNLSQRLPLLPKRQFREFTRQRLHNHKRHILGFADELDVLEEATEKLSLELASLDEENRKNLEKLEQMAMYDGLTALPNRNMLNFQIEKQLSQAKRTNQLTALLFIDLDDFKKVNDVYGHEVGDKLLKLVARRIAECLRDSDIITRFGGDEFVTLLGDIESVQQAERVASKLVSSFIAPLKVDDRVFHIALSIGVSVSKGDEFSGVELLKHADIAMFEAKRVSGSCFRVFDNNMNAKVTRRVDLESAARTALLENQFRVALQPIIELSTKALISFEALLRWHHPDKGLIPPSEFIPILEDTPFMLQLDYWVITKACQLLQEFNENGLGNIKLSINLSAGQFTDPALPDYLLEQLNKYGVKAENLQLELTETALVSDMAITVAIIEKIRLLGCKIAIDDFGTGYASLSYLKNIPADVVKLDQSFIAGMLEQKSDRNIVYATVSMVGSIDKVTVAEGIEIASQYELLCHFECQQGQGYLISKPIDEDAIWYELQQKLHHGIWRVELPEAGEDENTLPVV
jgi:diguanylate cyclase (GGDEF)-like protein